MEYIIIIIIAVITIILIKIGLNVHIKDLKKIKEIGYDKDLNKIANKFPENKEICEEILRKLNNKSVKIEENNDSKASLYIALTNKIIIANIKDSFTRIQTIAHECLHSVQNRNILIFNFIFSNLYLLSFILFIILIFLKIGNPTLYILGYLMLTVIYILIRGYLENEAMSKAYYVAKAYMEYYAKEDDKINTEDIEILTKNFGEINNVGIPLTNFWLTTVCFIKIIILSLLAFVMKF